MVSRFFLCSAMDGADIGAYISVAATHSLIGYGRDSAGGVASCSFAGTSAGTAVATVVVAAVMEKIIVVVAGPGEISGSVSGRFSSDSWRRY